MTWRKTWNDNWGRPNIRVERFDDAYIDGDFRAIRKYPDMWKVIIDEPDTMVVISLADRPTCIVYQRRDDLPLDADT